jgi:hypothetical protein
MLRRMTDAAVRVYLVKPAFSDQMSALLGSRGLRFQRAPGLTEIPNEQFKVFFPTEADADAFWPSIENSWHAFRAVPVERQP